MGATYSKQSKTPPLMDWTKKFAENVARDNKVVGELSSLGWASMIVWECQTRDADTLAPSLSAFLKD